MQSLNDIAATIALRPLLGSPAVRWIALLVAWHDLNSRGVLMQDGFER